MLIVAVCASVGCFQCPLFGLPDRTLLRERERETSEQCAEQVFFRTVWALFRDSCLIQTPKGTAGEHTVFVCGCWGMDLFSLHLIVKHAFTVHIYVLPFCVSASVLSSHDMKGWSWCWCTFTRLTRTVFSRCSAAKMNVPAVHKLPSFESLCSVRQGTRSRLAGVSASWDLFSLWSRLSAYVNIRRKWISLFALVREAFHQRLQ